MEIKCWKAHFSVSMFHNNLTYGNIDVKPKALSQIIVGRELDLVAKTRFYFFVCNGAVHRGV